ncbi:hypothetical protein GH714_023320 [Hevea brasiliensis]|uniref:Secreted protein n=1 Tax=Hevea brasiliensis TaxID=3981 RepID=A0A6A6LIW3_HEVBR|nr:hypothetical protein GH714_023320 [Hevea brasiliensis]
MMISRTGCLLCLLAFPSNVEPVVAKYDHLSAYSLSLLQCESVFLGVEARGFCWPFNALAIGAKFVPLSKPSKCLNASELKLLNARVLLGCLSLRCSVGKTMAGNIVVDMTFQATYASKIFLVTSYHELTDMDVVLLQGQFRLNGKPLYILVEPRQ